LSKGQIIAIDGKTIRGAKSHAKTSPIHMVSAWASENNLVLGQVKTNEKSNEITAIPELLDIINIAGNIITTGAMGTQKEITKKIINQDADYILAVKANQPQLLEHILDKFRFSKELETYVNHDLGQGRIETRKCTLISDFQFIEPNNGWESLRSIIKIESSREFKNSDKPIEKATRYYISSLRNNATEFQSKIRSHWAIENKLHWTLDVAFSEDASRKRAGNAAQNYSILLKIALNLLKNETSKKLSMKSKRLEAGWNQTNLMKILNIKV
jgi:predicted transposase YbfD/YdcC